MKAIMNDEVMERLIDTLMELQKKESTDLPLLKKQLAETEKGINNMLNARSSRRRLSPPTSHTTGHAVPHPAVQLT